MGEGGITCPLDTPVCDKMHPLLAPLCVEGIHFISPLSSCHLSSLNLFKTSFQTSICLRVLRLQMLLQMKKS